MDIRTFTEKKEKPYLLPYPENPLVDAIHFFHGEMGGHVLDFLYHLFKTVHSNTGKRNKRRFKRTLESTYSMDPDYIEKLLKTSLDKTKKKLSPKKVKEGEPADFEEIKEDAKEDPEFIKTVKEPKTPASPGM